MEVEELVNTMVDNEYTLDDVKQLELVCSCCGNGVEPFGGYLEHIGAWQQKHYYCYNCVEKAQEIINNKESEE